MGMGGRLGRIGIEFAKLSLAAGVFAAVLGGWSVAEPLVRARLALPDDKTTTGPCAVWFVGSSSVHRWTSMAADMAPWPTHNRGVNGALLAEVSARFTRSGENAPPTAIVFYVGENDLAAGMSAEAVTSGILALVADARRRMPQARLFVVGMKPSPTRWQFRAAQLRVNAEVAQAAARDRTFAFLPIGDALLVDGRPGDFYQPDGIHLDAEGYSHWAGALRVAFERGMPAALTARCAPPVAAGKRTA